MENGVIVMYETLPKNYSSQTLGVPIVDFSTMSEEIHQSEGFFDVVTPEPDFYTQKLGEIYFDDAKGIFTYPVLQLEVPLPKPISLKTLEQRVDELTILNNALIEALAMKGIVP